jgi:hypothetical protein
MFQRKVLPPSTGSKSKGSSFFWFACTVYSSTLKLIAAYLAYSNPEDGNIMSLENINKPLPDYITSHTTVTAVRYCN